MQFGKVTALQVAAGPHRLSFQNNLSSRSPVPATSTVPTINTVPVTFAPSDPRDLGVALWGLKLLPQATSLPNTALPLDLLRSEHVQKSGYYLLRRKSPYLVVADDGLTTLFRTPGPTVLHYSFIRARQGQQFSFLLDGHPFSQTQAAEVASVVRGQVELPRLGGSLHKLTIQPIDKGDFRHTSYLLADTAIGSLDAEFYVDQLTLEMPSSLLWPLLAAVALATIGTWLCFRLLLGAPRNVLAKLNNRHRV
jgi:hypothetical protein